MTGHRPSALALAVFVLHSQSLAQADVQPIVGEPELPSIALVNSSNRPLPMQLSHLSISRGLPGHLAALANQSDMSIDADAVRFVLCGAQLPPAVDIRTLDRAGNSFDQKLRVPLERTLLASEPGKACVQSPLVRITPERFDAHCASSGLCQLEGQSGGQLQLGHGKQTWFSIAVAGPQQVPFGPTVWRAQLRVRIVRTWAKGVPPIGRDDSAAVALVRHEIHIANQLWGQCGIFFGDEAETDVVVVDPPEPAMLSLGCGAGLVASGGDVALQIGPHKLGIQTRSGDSPRVVALRLARSAEALGIRTEIHVNPRIQPAAQESIDLEFRSRSGTRLPIRAIPNRSLSDDPTLGICVGIVDLTDGLDHFTNSSAMAGTLEERSLLRSVVDRDPGTIDVVVIEGFSRPGRIGESFVGSEAGYLGNVVIINPAALRVGAKSFALAHELGHILLDQPGHPDDYGVDTPWSLMDSDAVDGTLYGPKHLTRSDCVRAIVQSGPGSPVPLLERW